MRQFLVLCTGLAFLATGGVSGQTPKQKAEVENLLKILKDAKDPKARAGAANQLSDLGQIRTVLIRAAEPAVLVNQYTETFVSI